MIRFDAWAQLLRRSGDASGDAPESLGSDSGVPATSQKLRSMARPASPDFSGWNCRPKIAPRSTTLANVFGPVVVVAAVASPTGAANECVK